MKTKVAHMGIYLAVAMVCSYVESLIPINFGIPGVKLGLANIVVLLMLYRVGWKEALLVAILRILLTGFMFGNVFSILYSLSGGMLSFVVMLVLIRLDFLHCISVSIAGGISHNIGQLTAAAILVSSIQILYYLPVLLAAGALTGFLIGLLVGEIGKRKI